MNYQSLYTPEHNVELYHATKCAMTTVRTFLKMSWSDSELLPSDRKVCAVIRDPLQRFLSGFLFIGSQMVVPEALAQHCSLYQLRPVSYQSIFSGTPEQCFLNYINEIEKNSFFDSHNIRQVDFLEGKYAKEVFSRTQPLQKISYRKVSHITHFIRFNKLESDIGKMLGESIKLPHLNKSPGLLKNKMQNILSDNAARIHSLYKEDFNLGK